MQIIKQKPETHDQRNSFLTDNRNKKNTVGTVNIYSVATSTSLDTLQPLYDEAVNELNNLAAAKVQGNVNQDSFEDIARNTSSQFYQVFNFGVRRFVGPGYTTTLFKASDRAYYGQPVINGNVPRLDTLTRVKTFLGQIILGDANRVAAGGAAMSNPSAADVTAINTALLGKVTIANSADQAYIDQLVVVALLNEEVDSLILVMMAEADLFYVASVDSAKRTNLKLWGYKYYSIGSGADITFTVLDSVTLLPINLAEAKLDANGDSGTSGPDGIIALHTTIVDAAIVNFEAPLYNKLAYPITIVDKSVTAYTIHLVKVLPTV